MDKREPVVPGGEANSVLQPSGASSRATELAPHTASNSSLLSLNSPTRSHALAQFESSSTTARPSRLRTDPILLCPTKPQHLSSVTKPGANTGSAPGAATW